MCVCVCVVWTWPPGWGWCHCYRRRSRRRPRQGSGWGRKWAPKGKSTRRGRLGSINYKKEIRRKVGEEERSKEGIIMINTEINERQRGWKWFKLNWNSQRFPTRQDRQPRPSAEHKEDASAHTQHHHNDKGCEESKRAHVIQLIECLSCPSDRKGSGRGNDSTLFSKQWWKSEKENEKEREWAREMESDRREYVGSASSTFDCVAFTTFWIVITWKIQSYINRIFKKILKIPKQTKKHSHSLPSIPWPHKSIGISLFSLSLPLSSPLSFSLFHSHIPFPPLPSPPD